MLHDLRYAFRTLRRSPGFAVSAVLALALGIGANTAVFSVVYAVLLKPLPYAEADRLVRLYEINRHDGIDRESVSAGTFVEWRERARTLEGVAAFTIPFGGETLWTAGDQVMVVKSSAVSPSLFSVLRVQPILGRTFTAEGQPAAPGALAELVISYGLWQRAFGGAADVVGRTVMVEGRLPREIVGVMPRGFAFPDESEAWSRMTMERVVPAQRWVRTFEVVARLARPATIDDVRRELAGICAQLASEQRASNAGWTARVEPLAGSDTGAASLALVVLMTAVAGVLLIGCINVANLLLARATARRREISVRLALGAGTSRVVRLLMSEAGLLCVGGLAAGLALGHWMTRALIRLAPPDIPRLADVEMSGPVALFAAGAGVLCVVLTGLAPALQAARADLLRAMRTDARSVTPGGRLRRRLVAGQVAIVVVLLTGALLLVRTFVNLRHVDLGFETSQVVEVETRWPIGRLNPGASVVKPWPRIQRAIDGVLEAVGTVPGVDRVGMISDVPLTGGSFEMSVWRADAPGASGLNPPSDARDRWKADLSVVSPGYFDALNVPLLRGRSFTAFDRLSDAQLNDSDAPRAAVAIINAAFARQYSRGEDPIGRTLVLPDDQEFGWARTIVGVVADVRGRAVGEQPRPAIFIPSGQHPDLIRPSLIVRSSLPFDVTARAIRHHLQAYDPQLLVLRIRPMDALVSGALSRPRFNLLLLSSFAAVALVLSAIGIYGVLAYLVTQRTREIGVRMAVGARAADVRRLVLRDGMTSVAWGACAGIGGSVVLARAIRSLLFGVSPLDAVSLIGAASLVLLVALLACDVPARRATRVDPIVALRDE